MQGCFSFTLPPNAEFSVENLPPVIRAVTEHRLRTGPAPCQLFTRYSFLASPRPSFESAKIPGKALKKEKHHPRSKTPSASPQHPAALYRSKGAPVGGYLIDWALKWIPPPSPWAS